MDLDREISPAASLQREDQEMQEPHPQPPVNPEEPRSTEPAGEQEQTPDCDPKDSSSPQRHENASQQPQQSAVKIEHSYRHGSIEETHHQVDRPDLSYQHVQSYRHDSEHRTRTQPSQQSNRYGPEQQQQQQQVSYHYGREQERSHSHQQTSSTPPAQSSLEHPLQHQEHTTQDYSIQEGSNHDNQQDCVTFMPISSEPSPVIKQSPGSSPPPSFDAAAAPAVDPEELPHAQTSSNTESGDVPQSRPIGSPEDHPRDVKQDTSMLSPEPRPNNKRHSVSDEPDPADLVDPSTEAGTSSSLDHPGTGASGSGGNAGNSGDESSGSYPRSSKVPRKVREPIRKIPKVYPPRKPRVRPVAVEHLTMTIRTDSALSTLASAAVAIKDHQGPLSTLSVPPLSPNIHAPSSSTSPPSHHHHHDGSPSSSTSTPKVPIAPTSTGGGAAPGAGAGAGGGGSQAGSRGGRASNKANIPQDAGGYRCELCPGERFGRVHDLKRHQISKHNEMTWPCDFCHRPFVRRDALLRHYAVKASRRDGVHPTTQEESRLQEAKARAKLLS